MIRETTDPLMAGAARPLVVVLNKAGVRPNHITLLGGLLSCAGAGFIAAGWLRTGMLVLIFTWLFDVLDGVLAKYAKQVSRFGGFFDSVTDRYTEGMVFAALVYHYAKNGDPLMAGVTAVALIGASAVSYARARAEKEIDSCAVGVGDRLIRLVTLAFFTLIGDSRIGVILVLLLAHYTVLQRVLYTRKTLSAGQKSDTGGK